MIILCQSPPAVCYSCTSLHITIPRFAGIIVLVSSLPEMNSINSVGFGIENKNHFFLISSCGGIRNIQPLSIQPNNHYFLMFLGLINICIKNRNRYSYHFLIRITYFPAEQHKLGEEFFFPCFFYEY